MELIVPSLPVQMIVLVWEHVTLQQEHAHAMLDVTEMTVPSLPVPMTVLVWEHVILQQDYAHAMLDVPEMTVPSLPVRIYLFCLLLTLKFPFLSKNDGKKWHRIFLLLLDDPLWQYLLTCQANLAFLV